MYIIIPYRFWLITLLPHSCGRVLICHSRYLTVTAAGTVREDKVSADDKTQKHDIAIYLVNCGQRQLETKPRPRTAGPGIRLRRPRRARDHSPGTPTRAAGSAPQ